MICMSRRTDAQLRSPSSAVMSVALEQRPSRRSRLDQAQHRAASGRLAAAGLADQPEGLAARDRRNRRRRPRAAWPTAAEQPLRNGKCLVRSCDLEQRARCMRARPGKSAAGGRRAAGDRATSSHGTVCASAQRVRDAARSAARSGSRGDGLLRRSGSGRGWSASRAASLVELAAPRASRPVV